ncbi:MAG: DUF1674 domain-containing protein [Pseudomonadota bacterium]
MKQGDSKSTGPAVSDGKEPSEDQPSSGTEPTEKAPREIGGRDGPDPTRFGDWEKNGRCIDF